MKSIFRLFPRGNKSPSSQTSPAKHVSIEERTRAAQEAAAKILTFEEACAAWNQADCHDNIEFPIVRNRVFELAAELIRTATCIGDLAKINESPIHFTNCPLTHGPMLSQWAKLSTTSAEARRAYDWSESWEPNDASVQETVNARLDELVIHDSRNANTVEDARNIYRLSRSDSDAESFAAQRWIWLCTTLSDVRGLTDELNRTRFSNAAWLRRRAVEYLAASSITTPAMAKKLYAEIDLPVRREIITRWDELSLAVVKSSQRDVNLVEAFADARDGSEAQMLAITIMAQRLKARA